MAWCKIGFSPAPQRAAYCHSLACVAFIKDVCPGLNRLQGTYVAWYGTASTHVTKTANQIEHARESSNRNEEATRKAKCKRRKKKQKKPPAMT
jgi:hypothetical protein